MEKLISIQKTSEFLGVSQNTLRSWGEHGKLKAIRTEGGHRRYKLSEVQKMQGERGIEMNKDVVAVYCRVSSHEQKEKGDLERQKGRILEYCVNKKHAVGHILEDVSSGMKGQRPKLNKLYELVANQEINRVVVDYKDRLTRFQFDVFERFFSSHGVEIECVSVSLPKSYENELVEDILALMASFSGKIYGNRSGQRRKLNNVK